MITGNQLIIRYGVVIAEGVGLTKSADVCQMSETTDRQLQTKKTQTNRHAYLIETDRQTETDRHRQTEVRVYLEVH